MKHGSMKHGLVLDDIDLRIVRATQAGLPLSARPYDVVADHVGTSAEEVMRRLRRMLDKGIIRRIGAVPNHYALGYRANGMTVWDVVNRRVDALGEQIGALDFVTHCYRRTRHLPEWRYNLFAMVHARDRVEVEARAAQIADILGLDCRAHAILYSTRILKKTGLRI